jgi:hypothetical protein
MDLSFNTSIGKYNSKTATMANLIAGAYKWLGESMKWSELLDDAEKRAEVMNNPGLAAMYLHLIQRYKENRDNAQREYEAYVRLLNNGNQVPMWNPNAQ